MIIPQNQKWLKGHIFSNFRAGHVYLKQEEVYF